MTIFKWKKILCGLLLVIMLCGCSIVNPYNENFACRAKDENGHCVGMDVAYSASIGQIDFDESSEAVNECQDCDISQKATFDFNKMTNRKRQSSKRKEYQDAVYSRLTGLLQKPETPMVDPPRIMRVLILPYEDSNKVLFMPRYTYIKVEESKWIVGDYLVNGLED